MIPDPDQICPGCGRVAVNGFGAVIAQGKGGLNIAFCDKECRERFLKASGANRQNIVVFH